jgi:hypothetical protein
VAENKQLIKLDEPKSIAEFLKQPAVKMAEFLTGILISETKDWKLSAGRLVQASIQSKLYTQLGREIGDYIEKGKIKEDFLDNDHSRQSIAELLKFIDESAPDETRFNAMKSLFIRSVSVDSDEDIKALSYQFMKLCKDLESAHLLILKATYEIWREIEGKKKVKFETAGGTINITAGGSSATAWLKNIAAKIGHNIIYLVEVHEGKLIDFKLIYPRRTRDLSWVASMTNYRLTDLGLRLCEFIYEDKE